LEKTGCGFPSVVHWKIYVQKLVRFHDHHDHGRDAAVWRSNGPNADADCSFYGIAG